MASSKVPDAVVRKVANAFFDMAKDARGRDVLAQASSVIGLPQDTRFVPASGADYAAYRRFYQSAPLALR